MRLALVSNERKAATPGAKGRCPACNAPMTAKCGTKVIWHWAHSGRRHCDPWWENETQWHIEWKNCFPLNFQEIVQHDSLTGEKHIADVKTARGMVIEFQNSPISVEELKSRELFYQHMIWIVNGQKFGRRFHILSPLPDPKAQFVDDIMFFQQLRDHAALMFCRRSKLPAGWRSGDMVEVESAEDIQDQIKAAYTGYHMFDWKRPHTVWFDATTPVFFDFGDAYLWRLRTYGDYGLRAVQRVEKERLVAKNGGNYSVA